MLSDRSLQHFGQADESLMQEEVNLARPAYCYGFSKFSIRSLLCLDLFPNVDQRVGRFLKLLLKQFTNFVVTPTVNNTGRFFPRKRLYGNEIMTASPRTSAILNALLMYLNIPLAQIFPTGLFDTSRAVVVLQEG